MKIKHQLAAFCILAVVSFTACKKNYTETDIAPINPENDKDVGASANDLLSASKYQSVVLEIFTVPGYELDGNAVYQLTSFMETLLNKPGGISVLQKQISSAGKPVVTLADVANMEKISRTSYTSGNQLGIYILVTDATYTDASVLAFAYRNTSICLFGKTIKDHSGGVNQPEPRTLEATALEHEMGHLLGLVNTGSPLQSNHQDLAHDNHCINEKCLMYYKAETTSIAGLFISNNVPALDANCRADLKANGGK